MPRHRKNRFKRQRRREAARSTLLTSLVIASALAVALLVARPATAALPPPPPPALLNEQASEMALPLVPMAPLQLLPLEDEPGVNFWPDELQPAAESFTQLEC